MDVIAFCAAPIVDIYLFPNPLTVLFNCILTNLCVPVTVDSKSGVDIRSRVVERYNDPNPLTVLLRFGVEIIPGNDEIYCCPKPPTVDRRDPKNSVLVMPFGTITLLSYIKLLL